MSDSEPLVEAVPNISEGRDHRVIDRIAAAFHSEGARVLHVDSNPDAHRTVITLAGPLGAVERACFHGVAEAVELIDMRRHRGAHPRVGAADVVPLVPLDWGDGRLGGAMAETVAAATRLGRRLADDLGLPVFFYEHSALRPAFFPLPHCRKGGWEALPQRWLDPDDGPDLGPRVWTPDLARCGATVVGARDLLIALNITLQSSDGALARELAARIRSSGPEGPDRLPGLRCVGWSMPSFADRVQVSCNLIDPRTTRPWDVLTRLRKISPVPILGAEPIGLFPALALLDAARASTAKLRPDWPTNVAIFQGADPDEVAAGARVLGLDHLGPTGDRTLECSLFTADPR